MEDVKEGMAEGPYTLQEAADRCQCKPEELCFTPLAGKDEGNKVRTIQDGTKCGANPHIRHHTPQKTLVPHIPDLLHALAVISAEAVVTHYPMLLKMDITKAHRRIKVMRKDWKYIATKVGDEVFLNTAGAFGIASAQYYWGRMAAALLRLPLSLGPRKRRRASNVGNGCWVVGKARQAVVECC